MRTYLLKIPEILKGVSNSLDVIATLCNKSWLVFNDESIKLLFIFESDGTLLVSKNGVVSKQKWSYIKANSTLLIENNQQAFLLHPMFVDNVVFALQQDGTQHLLFMIDEAQHAGLTLLTLDALNNYFEIKANKRHEAIARIEAERRRVEQEETSKRQKILLQEDRERKINKEIQQRTAQYEKKSMILAVLLVLLIPLNVISIIILIDFDVVWWVFLIYGIIMFVLLLALIYEFLSTANKSWEIQQQVRREINLNA